jgi:predicted Holliday junction resolvase-like endonuclease
MSRKLIRQLVSVPGLRIECPNCPEDPFPIKRAKLFGMYEPYPPRVRSILRERQQGAQELQADILQRKKTLALHRKQKPLRIATAAHASNFGQISEQILPAFLTFPYKRSECRVLLKPIDYVVFVNLAQQGRVDAIKFVDVKTGNGQLDIRQRAIRDRITQGKLRHTVIPTKR